MSTYATTTSNSTATWDYAKMMEAMTKIKDEMAKNPLAKIDYIVASKQGLELVKQKLGATEEKIPPSPLQALPNYLMGIPIKEYPTQREARIKAIEMYVRDHKNLLFIFDDGSCFEMIYPTSSPYDNPLLDMSQAMYPWNDDLNVVNRASNNG